MKRDAYAQLDAALTAIADGGPELANGLTNHGPMVAEALCAMGRGDAVADWIAAYRSDMTPWPSPTSPIVDGDATARGDLTRATDWRRYFRARLMVAPWPSVVAQSLSWLDRATCADATHGVIRVGHAVRSIAIEDTLARRNELADALASWAATFASLGGEADLRLRGLRLDEAMAQIPMLPSQRRRFRGTITSALEPLSDYAPFNDVLNALDSGTTAAQIAEAFTRVYLDNAVDTLTTIVFVHGVTSIAAVGRLIPHLAPDAGQRLVRFGWQSSAALFSAFGREPFASSTKAFPAPAESVADLTNAAVDHGDEHVIKFTQVCIEQYAHTGSSNFLAAASHIRTLLPAPAHLAGIARVR